MSQNDPIGFEYKGNEYQLRLVKRNKGQENEGWSDSMPATPFDLRCANYVPASEVATESTVTALEQLANSWWAESIKNHTVIREAGIWQRCAFELRTIIAKAVAPEQHPGLEQTRGDIDPVCDAVAPEPAQEAGGVERVSHGEARAELRNMMHGGYCKPGLMRRYIQQQEQAEREAAEAVELMAREHAAAIRIAADRDAERAQKEALRVELEGYRNRKRELDQELASKLDDIQQLRTERDELKRRVTWSNARFHLGVKAHLGGHSGGLLCSACACWCYQDPDLSLEVTRRAQQPAAAAPVATFPALPIDTNDEAIIDELMAKRAARVDESTAVCICGHQLADHSPEKGLCRFNSCGGCESFEAAPVAKAEAPSEPVAWVPTPGQRAYEAFARASHALVMPYRDFHHEKRACWEAAALANAASQPPAATGRENPWRKPIDADALLDWLKCSWADEDEPVAKAVLARLIETAGYRLGDFNAKADELGKEQS